MADAILAKKVYLCGTTCTPPNNKIKKTSIGAEKWVPYEYVENTLDIVKKLKEEGMYSRKTEKQRGWLETREYYYTEEIEWLIKRKEVKGIGALILTTEENGKK